eukprot:5062751-Pleurochrysis_carterae.AAC.1
MHAKKGINSRMQPGSSEGGGTQAEDLWVVLEDDVGGVVADEDGGRLRVDVGHVRLDRGVDDAQVRDAVHAQLAVDDGQRVRRGAHLARARPVPVGAG